MKIAVTGHRPDKLGGYDHDAKMKLFKFACWTLSGLREQYPNLEIISGMAQGWDMEIAAACRYLGISYTVAIPFYGQEQKWPPSTIERYHHLCNSAKLIHYRHRFVSADEINGALQDRNEWMVDHASQVVALWNGSSGGTANCVKYAERQKCPVINVWSDWENWDA